MFGLRVPPATLFGDTHQVPCSLRFIEHPNVLDRKRPAALVILLQEAIEVLDEDAIVERMLEDFDKWPIAREKHAVIRWIRAVGLVHELQAHERLSGSGHSGDQSKVPLPPLVRLHRQRRKVSNGIVDARACGTADAGKGLMAEDTAGSLDESRQWLVIGVEPFLDVGDDF